MRRRLASAVALSWLTACMTLVPGGQIAQERLAEEYHCPQKQVVVTSLPGNAYRAEGCGFSASYACTSNRDIGMTCVKEAGASPVPQRAIPAAPTATPN